MSQRNACLSCRSRKLKCDRKFPCSNCSGRGIECKQQHFVPGNRATPRRIQNTTSATLADVLARLDQIESIIGVTGKKNTTSPDSNEESAIAEDEASQISSNFDTRLDNDIEPIRTETGRLVSTSTNDNFLRNALQHDLALSVSGSSSDTPYSGNDLDGILTSPQSVELPAKDETLRRLEIYLRYGGNSQNILYAPYTRAMIDDVYDQVLHVSTTTAPRGLALIFSILAISVLLAPLDCEVSEISATMQGRLKVCAAYTRSTMDCLEQARRRMYHTLENVQAMVILSFLIHHVEAFSPRYRIILAEAFTIARILSLHRIDATAGRRVQKTDDEDPITQELKRRVWWYMVATDWLVSIANGPGDGIYLADPKHMTVNVPLHINDADLGKSNVVEQPFSQPTSMSYVLKRLEIARIARLISDMASSDSSNATYEQVHALNSRIDRYVEELPIFFRIDLADSLEVQAFDEKYPYLPIQRLILGIMTNLVRCKLHHPYLIGSPNAALHAFSRQICLKAAQTVFAAHRSLRAPNLAHTSDFMKIQGGFHLIFMGAVIMATDLCCNRPVGEEHEQQTAELMQACNLLANVQKHSQLARKLLESITGLLVKHGVWAPRTIVQQGATDHAIAEDHPTTEFSQQWQFSNYASVENSNEQQGLEMGWPFEDLWETFVERPAAMDMIDFT